jgi:hypothetical protein
VLGSKASAGHATPEPSQLSAASQSPAAGRQTPLFRYVSAGQSGPLPSQLSGASHTSAAGRHTPLLAKSSAGQLVADPSQVSATSQTPADARQGVPDGLALCVQVPVALQTSVLHGKPSLVQGLPLGSYWQADEQQSPFDVLPSSHCSPASIVELPQGESKKNPRLAAGRA